mgnify:CR=1 FL=1
MSEKQFIVEKLEILNDENDFKGEYWWAVTNTERIEDCFECRNKEVALKLCDFLNKSSDDFKWQIRQCEKWSAIVKQLKKENEKLQKQIQNYEQLIDNAYVGEEETLDGFTGKYVIWENELQKYKNKNEMIDNE